MLPWVRCDQNGGSWLQEQEDQHSTRNAAEKWHGIACSDTLWEREQGEQPCGDAFRAARFAGGRPSLSRSCRSPLLLGFLASMRGQLFRHEGFAEFYRPDDGAIVFYELKLRACFVAINSPRDIRRSRCLSGTGSQTGQGRLWHTGFSPIGGGAFDHRSAAYGYHPRASTRSGQLAWPQCFRSANLPRATRRWAVSC